MKSILFVCDANRFRSVIAAEYFLFLLQKNNYLMNGMWNALVHGLLEDYCHYNRALSIMKYFWNIIIHIDLVK